LGIFQPTLAHCEVGRLRIAVFTLVPLSKILSCSIDELIYGEEAAKGQNKRGPVSKLQQQVDQVRQLPQTKQQFVMEMLNTVIQQAANPKQTIMNAISIAAIAAIQLATTRIAMRCQPSG